MGCSHGCEVAEQYLGEDKWGLDPEVPTFTGGKQLLPERRKQARWHLLMEGCRPAAASSQADRNAEQARLGQAQ